MDLKDKLKTLDKLSVKSRSEKVSSYLDTADELYAALEGLGYNKKEIDGIITIDELKNFKNIEDAIKAVLKKLNSNV